jgi:sortase (surface protein transpeptidase)
MTATDLLVDGGPDFQPLDGGPPLVVRTDPFGAPVGAQPREEPPPLGPRLQVARAALVVVIIMALMMVLQLVVVSSMQHSARQQRAFAALRSQLARGTAPIGAVNADGDLMRIGTPIANIVIPSIGVDEVIVEGTSSTALLHGPGHRRNTPFPGQEGISMILGRQAAFGGPFGRIDELEQGDEITVTTGQGVFEYVVFGVRREGDPIPPPTPDGTSRLVLVSADGFPFVPSSVVRVDADLVGPAVVAPPGPTIVLSSEEAVMAGDPSTIGALALWLLALMALGCALAWSWHRWGRIQTWVVFTPPLLVVGLAASAQVIRLLPNLL